MDGVRVMATAVETKVVPLVGRCVEVLGLACSHIDALVNQAEEYQVRIIYYIVKYLSHTNIYILISIYWYKGARVGEWLVESVY